MRNNATEKMLREALTSILYEVKEYGDNAHLTSLGAYYACKKAQDIVIEALAAASSGEVS